MDISETNPVDLSVTNPRETVTVAAKDKTSNLTFSGEAVLPSGSHVLREKATGADDLAKEQAYTNKVMFFYDEFPAFVNSTIVDGSTKTLRPDTTAVIGMYSDISALVLTGSFDGYYNGSWIAGATLGAIPSIKGNYLTLGDNEDRLLVYGYNGMLNSSEMSGFNYIYFKRYTNAGVSIDSGTIPDAGHAVQYYLIVRKRGNATGFAARFTYVSANYWELRDEEGNHYVRLDATKTERVHATLTYTRMMSDKCFPTPDGKLTDNGIFTLNIWSDDIVDLSIIKWNLQEY